MFLLDNTIERIKEIINENIEDNEYLGGNIDNKDTQDGLIENNPKPGDSIGLLTYKLNCVCIQMWHNQEFLYAVRKMTLDEFKDKYGSDLNNLHRMIKRCCDLNYQRSLLMDAIDKEAVRIAGDAAKKNQEMPHGHIG